MDTSDPFRCATGKCPLRVEPVVLQGISGSGLRASAGSEASTEDSGPRCRERLARWMGRSESVDPALSPDSQRHLRRSCRPAARDTRLLVHIAVCFVLGLCLVQIQRINAVPRQLRNFSSWSHVVLQRDRAWYVGLGTSEYGPEWVEPRVLRQLCQRAASEDSAVGLRWEAYLQARDSEYWYLLPCYFSGQNERAASVLATLGQRKEVFHRIHAEWPGWNEATRRRWMEAMLSSPHAGLYADVLGPELRAVDRTNAALAATLLIKAQGPVFEARKDALLQITRREMQDLKPGGRQTGLQHVLLEAWIERPKPDRAWMEALLAELRGHSPVHALLILLRQMDPALDVPEHVAEFQQLASVLKEQDQAKVLEWVRSDAPDSLKGRPWMIDWLGTIASIAQDPRFARSRFAGMIVRNRETAIEMLEGLGVRAAAAVPALFQVLESNAPVPVRRAAARAIANIAPPEARWIERTIPLLTQSMDMAPLLVWLAAIGPDAQAALPAVQALACNQGTLPDANMGCTRLEASWTSGLRGVDSRNRRAGPPSKARIHADWACPMSLKNSWPAKEKRGGTGATTFALKSEVMLDELAVLCYFRLNLAANRLDPVGGVESGIPLERGFKGAGPGSIGLLSTP